MWGRVASLELTWAAFSDFLGQVVLPPNDAVTERMVTLGTAPPMNLRTFVPAPTLWHYTHAREGHFRHEQMRGLIYEPGEAGGATVRVRATLYDSDLQMSLTLRGWYLLAFGKNVKMLVLPQGIHARAVTQKRDWETSAFVGSITRHLKGTPAEIAVARAGIAAAYDRHAVVLFDHTAAEQLVADLVRFAVLAAAAEDTMAGTSMQNERVNQMAAGTLTPTVGVSLSPHFYFQKLAAQQPVVGRPRIRWNVRRAYHYKSVMTETLYQRVKDRLRPEFQAVPIPLTAQFRAAVIREVDRLQARDEAAQLQQDAFDLDNADSDSPDGEIRAGVLHSSIGSGLSFGDLIPNHNLRDSILCDTIARRAFRMLSRVSITKPPSGIGISG